MLEDMDPNEGEVSDAMSDNEYEANLQLLREVDPNDNDDEHNIDLDLDHDPDHDNSRDVDTDPSTMADARTIKTGASVDGSAAEPKKKYDPKDPLRPRRKKARRACFACQRAHLTCGDERPCQRCIKRGLADGCQDGVRKKAKYLHDAPVEALRPVLGPNFNAAAASTNTPSRAANGHSHGHGHGHGQGHGQGHGHGHGHSHRHPSSAGSDVSVSNVPPFFTPSSGPSYPVFSASQTTPTGSNLDGLTFPAPQSPVSPDFAPPSSSDGTGHLSRMGLSSTPGGMAGFSPALFDPSNPALFNFNLEGINFGSQYAAMEFGMLGHMSSGAADDPNDPSSLSQQGGRNGSVVGGGGGGGGGYGSTSDVFGNGGVNPTLYDGSGTTPGGGAGGGGGGLMNDFMNLDPATGSGFYTQGNLQHGLPHAYAIAAAPASLQSPSTDNNSPQATSYGFEGSPTTAAYGLPGLGGGGSNGNNGGSNGNGSAAKSLQQSLQQQQQQQQQYKAKSAVSKVLPQSILGKRHRDPSSVYEAVKEPYMYVKGFHRLIALLQRRFSAVKILRIAKALSSIRPSFISCTRTLNRQDLVFMEKCFQRTLFEYEEFMTQVSSPTLVLRRTGEVAAVNKEFTALTGWSKDVLLGKAPNLNVNTGTSAASGSLANNANNASNANNGNNAVGPSATPRLRALNAEIAKSADGQQQPLFLAELMDDDNVIEFYEDFAQLAFGDSRGSVNRKCRLLKYRTREATDGSGGSGGGPAPGGSSGAVGEAAASAAASSSAGASGPVRPASSILSSRVARIDGEHGIAKIERDGKLECSYCWHIRRDTFDIPMMIVMNFLPCYYPNQEPHQLAV